MILKMDCQIAFLGSNVTTYDDATNILSFEGLIAGKYYTIVPNPPVNNGLIYRLQ